MALSLRNKTDLQCTIRKIYCKILSWKYPLNHYINVILIGTRMLETRSKKKCNIAFANNLYFVEVGHQVCVN